MPLALHVIVKLLSPGFVRCFQFGRSIVPFVDGNALQCTVPSTIKEGCGRPENISIESCLCLQHERKTNRHVWYKRGSAEPLP